MANQMPPFDPQALAQWLVDGLKDTVSYRIKQSLDKDKIIEFIKSKVPNKNQAVHFALKHIFEQSGFVFEELKQGDAMFHVIRKKFREIAPGKEVRRLVVVPGFGDSPASWIPPFTFLRSELPNHFDEVLIIDFPGYMGFLSQHAMVPSMAILQNVIKMVCEVNPPTVLIGHSLGGWLAGSVAQKLGKLMDHLILVAPSGLIPMSERQLFADLIVKSQDLPVEEFLGRVMHEPKKYQEFFVHEEVKAFYSKPEIKEFVDSVTEDQFIDPKKPFSAKKLTVVWGSEDQFVPAQWMRYWVEHFGTYLDAYILSETGHIPQLERPWVTAEVLMHAILEKPTRSGNHWKKIQSRKQQWTNKLLETFDHSTKLLK